jgi:hypothetical protein
MNARPVLEVSLCCLLIALPLPGIAGQEGTAPKPARVEAAKAKTPIRTLDDDPRLKAAISIEHESITVEKALQRLTALTKIKLRAHGLETSSALTVFSYRNTSVRDIMESLASARNLAWEYEPNGVWVASSAYDNSELDIHRPHNPAQADLARLGEKLADQISRLPGNIQQGLSDASHARFDPSDRSTVLDMFGVPLSELPADMQQTLREMVDLNSQDADWTGGQPPPTTDYRDARVRFGKPSRQEGFDAYALSVTSGYFEKALGGATSLGMQNHVNIHFNVFRNPRDRDNRIVSMEQAKSGGGAALAAKEIARMDAQSRAEAIDHDPRFQNRVSFTTSSVRFPGALLAVVRGATISAAAADYGKLRGPKPGWRVDESPLSDALDAIALTYGYTWGVTRAGVVVFHPALTELRSSESGTHAAKSMGLQPH